MKVNVYYFECSYVIFVVVMWMFSELVFEFNKVFSGFLYNIMVICLWSVVIEEMFV